MTLFDTGLYVQTGGITVNNLGVMVSGGVTLLSGGFTVLSGVTVASLGLTVSGGISVSGPSCCCCLNCLLSSDLQRYWSLGHS